MGELYLVVDLSFCIKRPEGQVIHVGQERMRLVADLDGQWQVLSIVQGGIKGADFEVARNAVYFIEVIEIYFGRCGHRLSI